MRDKTDPGPHHIFPVASYQHLIYLQHLLAYYEGISPLESDEMDRFEFKMFVDELMKTKDKERDALKQSFKGSSHG